MGEYKIGDLELSVENGFYITDPLDFPSSGKFEESSVWRSPKVHVSNISRNAVKGKISGKCTSRLSISNLLYYDSNNYDWNYDTENIYLTEDNTRMWKLKMVSVATKPVIGENFEFDINIVVADPSSDGILLKTLSSNTSTSPTNISGFTNEGDKNADFDSILITGEYLSASNAKTIKLVHNLSRYSLNITNELFHGAKIYLYPKNNNMNHIYEDFFVDSNKFNYNKSNSSGVTFSTDKLIFANSSYLIFKFDLLHPLAFDPILTLSITNLSGTPKVQVSKDGVYYWDIDKNLENGTQVEYILTKIRENIFYVKIYCGATSSFYLNYMELNSWHSISSQQPYIQVLAGALNDILICTLSSGKIYYDFSWRDKYNY